MNKSVSRRATILAIAASTFILPAAAQYGGDRSREIAGTWMLVSIVNTQPDGHFSVAFMSDGLPKFASGNRVKGTPSENQAIVQGSVAYFGTYSTDATDKLAPRQLSHPGELNLRNARR